MFEKNFKTIKGGQAPTGTKTEKIQQFQADKLKDMQCPKCKGICWEPALIWKIAPADKTITGKEENTAVTVNRCMDCGDIHPADKQFVYNPNA